MLRPFGGPLRAELGKPEPKTDFWRASRGDDALPGEPEKKEEMEEKKEVLDMAKGVVRWCQSLRVFVEPVGGDERESARDPLNRSFTMWISQEDRRRCVCVPRMCDAGLPICARAKEGGGELR